MPEGGPRVIGRTTTTLPMKCFRRSIPRVWNVAEKQEENLVDTLYDVVVLLEQKSALIPRTTQLEGAPLTFEGTIQQHSRKTCRLQLPDLPETGSQTCQTCKTRICQCLPYFCACCHFVHCIFTSTPLAQSLSGQRLLVLLVVLVFAWVVRSCHSFKFQLFFSRPKQSNHRPK